MKHDLNFLATAIGSLPNNNPKDAVDLIFDTIADAPLCPQLSKVSPDEDMLIQYTENFAGIKMNETTNKRYADLESDEYFAGIEELFTDYEEVISSDTLNDEILQKYVISKNYSAAFPYFLEKLKQTQPEYVKGQVIGPFTFGTSTLDTEKRCVFYDETYRDVIVKVLTLKALWQVNEFRKVSPKSKNIIFLDEPTMSQLGTSAFLTVSTEDVQNVINQIVDVLHQFNILVGMHCCGKADWSVVLKTNLDIINFDAFFYAENFSLYSKEIEEFLSNDGIIAWGIVPTLDVDALESTNSGKLVELFENSIKLLTSKGLDERKILDSSIITPSCGAGSLSIESAIKAMNYLKEVSKALKDKYSKEVV
ncbi:MAG: hypothetical protein MJ180_05720 [Candidatus Gastranaerophilales bacterium]|nr:hypothetical protein [Candidatus Gastranaerophilales bacterium]